MPAHPPVSAARTARCGRGEARTAPRRPLVSVTRPFETRRPLRREAAGRTHASTEPSQRKQTETCGARCGAPHGAVLQGHEEVTARDGENGASSTAPRSPPAGTAPLPEASGARGRAGQQPAPDRVGEAPWDGTARPAPPPPPP